MMMKIQPLHLRIEVLLFKLTRRLLSRAHARPMRKKRVLPQFPLLIPVLLLPLSLLFSPETIYTPFSYPSFDIHFVYLETSLVARRLDRHTNHQHRIDMILLTILFDNCNIFRAIGLTLPILSVHLILNLNLIGTLI